jgi:hypothetical protein
VNIPGDLNVTGTKNFNIPHPAKPGYRLVHSAIEGPEAGVYYRGEATLINGEATVTLPEYFEALTRLEGRTVQLTCKNGWSPLFIDGEIVNGKFKVRTTGNGNLNQVFHWEVKAIRSDLPALEVEKPDSPTDWPKQ